MFGIICIGIFGVIGGLVFIRGIRIVRPTHVMLVETLGKFKSERKAGFHWIMPIIQKGLLVNKTERMIDIGPQTIITEDNLNVAIDAVVYYQIIDARAAAYNIDNHRYQLASLARTTLRAVLGKMTFAEANEQRQEINKNMEGSLVKETKSYGLNILRVEIQRIEAPGNVQQSMNQVVIAAREKMAATDFAIQY